jgi:hypothetical protein
MEHPTGESDDGSLRLDFDRCLKLEFHGTRITSGAGLLAYRELDDALGLTDLAGAAPSECRRGGNTRHGRSIIFQMAERGVSCQPRGLRVDCCAVDLAGQAQPWLSFTQAVRMGQAYEKCRIRFCSANRSPRPVRGPVAQSSVSMK